MTFTEFIKPKYYDSFVEAVLNVRATNKQMALTMGHYLKKLALIKLTQSIKNQSETGKLESREFLELFSTSWCDEVSSSTLRMQQLNKVNTKTLLPTVEDLDKLTKFIETQLDQDLEYTKLQKFVVASLLLYNKRRPAEVTEMKINEYRRSFDNRDDREEIISTFSSEEKAMAERYFYLR